MPLKHYLRAMAASNKILMFTVIFTSVFVQSQAQRTDFWNTNFAKADSIAFKYYDYDLKDPQELAALLTSTLDTEVEKFRAIFRWITDNISYDYPLYLKHNKTNKPNYNKRSKLTTRLSKKGLRHLVLRKKAVCAGYATLLDYMCAHSGIESAYIVGYGRNYRESYAQPNHAWNAVKLDNKWYLCDVTWASGSVDHNLGRFFKDYTGIYFLTDPSLFICNHYPVEKRWTLVKNPPSLTEFLHSAFKASGFIQNKINTYSPSDKTQRLKITDKFKLRFTSNADRIDDKALIKIYKKNDNEYSRNEVSLKKDNTGEYILEHSFTEKGSFELLILINDIHTFTYDVIVI